MFILVRQIENSQKVEFEEKLEELERSLSWRKLAKCMRWTSALANTIFIVSNLSGHPIN